MTEEEYRQIQEERSRLINEYNSLVNQYNKLVEHLSQITAELDLAQDNAIIVINNARAVAAVTLPVLDCSIERTDEVRNAIYVVAQAIEQMREKYFQIKNVSTSSKKLTELDDIYNKKFRFYGKLRKVALGYVIGIDANIISNETLRKEVEKQQLMNSDYWLSYALSSIMLWVNDAQNASERGMNKALDLQQYKSILFFMLVNLRFGRTEAAKKWYYLFSEDVDIFNIRPEWEFILQAYLHHGFGNDKEFEKHVKSQFVEMLNEMKNSFPGYERKLIEKVVRFGFAFPYSTNKDYEYLQLYCKDYKLLKELLNNAERKSELAKYYISIFEEDDQSANNLSENLENVLYDLISAYDNEEYEIFKQIKYHEYVVKSNGDLKLANQMFNLQTENDNKTVSLDELMFKFAFADRNNRIDNRLQKFAISFMINEIKKGYDAYQQEYKKKEKNTYTMYIDGCTFEHNELSLNDSRNAIVKYYKDNMRKKKFNDKKLKVYLGGFLGSLLLTLIMVAAVIIAGKFTTATAVVLGVGMIFSILFCLLYIFRNKSRTKHIKDEMLRSLEKLNKVNEDFINWKKDYTVADNLQSDLQEALNKYKWEDENE